MKMIIDGKVRNTEKMEELYHRSGIGAYDAGEETIFKDQRDGKYFYFWYWRASGIGSDTLERITNLFQFCEENGIVLSDELEKELENL